MVPTLRRAAGKQTAPTAALIPHDSSAAKQVPALRLKLFIYHIANYDSPDVPATPSRLPVHPRERSENKLRRRNAEVGFKRRGVARSSAGVEALRFFS